jgi:hydroxymethylglutaryl-CoA reductase (NADPH)
MGKTEIRCVEKIKVEMDCYFLGPFLVRGEYADGEFNVPFITTELPVILAVNRGRKIGNLAGGVNVKILKDEMTRAPLITTVSHETALRLEKYIKEHFPILEGIVSETTRFGRLTSVETRIYEMDLYMRVGMFCGDAAGHNMSEKGAIAICKHLENLPEFRGKISLLSVSSNFCTDKKASAINLSRGRGKWVKASAEVPRAIVETGLGVSPEQIVELNYKKNVVGSRLAGILGGQNSHYANMVAAVFLATGQDIANVVEGSMGYTTALCTREGNLEFSIEMPCLIVGTVGGGTQLPYARKNLRKIGCLGGGNPPGVNAKKFAEIIGAVVWAGELSTMAELAKGADFIRAHLDFERNE